MGMAQGFTRETAMAATRAPAFGVLAQRLEHGEARPIAIRVLEALKRKGWREKRQIGSHRMIAQGCWRESWGRHPSAKSHQQK